MARCESCDNNYTYCGLCGHTPTRVGHMGSTIWAVRMWWHNMVSSRHTYSGPCGHTGVSLYTQFSPCGHRIFMSIYSSCGPCDQARDSCSSIYPLQPWWLSKKMLMQILMPIVAHVATWESRENIYTYCDLRRWPHSQDSGPHGLGHMGRPNAMV